MIQDHMFAAGLFTLVPACFCVTEMKFVCHVLLLCVDELDVGIAFSSEVLAGFVFGEGVEYGDAFGLVLFFVLLLADEVVDSHLAIDSEVAVHEVFPLLKITTVDNFGHYDSFPVLYELIIKRAEITGIEPVNIIIYSQLFRMGDVLAFRSHSVFEFM